MEKRIEVAPQIVFPNDYRSYIIVALTVQAPLAITDVGNKASVTSIPGLTQTIMQPAGRLMAQACHATDVLSAMTVKNYIRHAQKHNKKLPDEFWTQPPSPLTRITLAARDSYELYHVRELLRRAGITVWEFSDTNEAYGHPGIGVLTAIATEGIHKEDSIGLVDYLPLWSPEAR